MIQENKPATALRLAVAIGLIALPQVLFLYTPNLYFASVTGRNFMFRSAVEALLGLFLVLSMVDRRRALRFSRSLAAFAAYVAVLAVADLAGVNPLRSFFSNFERMDGWIGLAHVFAYLFLLVNVLRRQEWDFLLWSFLAQGLLQIGSGMTQVLGLRPIAQGVRVDANFGNATYFAGFLVFTFFAAALAALRGRRVWLKAAAGVVGLAAAAMIYPTQSRGAYLALFGGIVVAALCLAVAGTRRQRAASLVGLALVAAAVAGAWLAKDLPAVKANPESFRAASLFSPGRLAQDGRFQVWQVAWRGFQDRPVLGWGQENFPMVFDKHYPPAMYGQELWFDRAHNGALDCLVSAGVLGIAAWLALFGAALWSLWRKRNALPLPQKALLSAALAAYLIDNLTLFDQLGSYLALAFILAFSHAGFPEPDAPRPEGRRWGAAALGGGIAAVAVAVVAAVAFLNAVPASAAGDLVSALRQRTVLGADQCLYSYQNAVAKAGPYSPEVSEQLLSTAVAMNNATTVALEVRRGFLALASAENDRQERENPLFSRAWQMSGMFRAKTGDLPGSVRSFEQAVRLSPTRQYYLFNLAKAYLTVRQPDKALACARGAYESAPRIPELARQYALVAAGAGDDATVKRLMGSDPVFDHDFFAAYQENGRMDKVVQAWRGQAAAHPDSVDPQVSLAAAQYEGGDKAAALATLQTAAKAFPAQRAQLEQFADDIRSGRMPRGRPQD